MPQRKTDAPTKTYDSHFTRYTAYLAPTRRLGFQSTHYILCLRPQAKKPASARLRPQAKEPASALLLTSREAVAARTYPTPRGCTRPATTRQ